jgi:hypothetical protein
LRRKKDMIRNRFAACLFAVTASLAALTTPRSARAELTDAVYSDAKDIIEELLSSEVAHEVAPGIGCLSGQRNAVATDALAVTYKYKQGDKDVSKTVRLEATTHFPKTLQHIYNRQYGTLRTVIRDESANLAGYLVFQALYAAAVSPKPLAPTSTTPTAPGAAAPPPPAATPAQVAISDYVATVSAQLGKASKDCPTDPHGEPTCAALSGATASKVSFQNISPAELTACKDAVRQKFDDGTWGQVSTYPLDVECKAQARESFECDVAYAVRSALLGQVAPTQDNLIKATAVAVRQIAAEVYPANEALLDTIQQQVLFLLRQQLAGDGWEAKPLAERFSVIAKAAESLDLSKLEEAARSEFLEKLSTAEDPSKVQELLTTLAKVTDVSKLSEEQKKGILTRAGGILKLLQKLEQVHAAWRSSIDVDTGKIDVTAFVRALVANGGALRSICESHVGSLACGVIDRLGSVYGSGKVADKVDEALTQLQSILGYASNHDYTAAAQTAVRYVFQQIDKGDSPEVGVYERFAESVVAYVLDAADDKTPSAAARVAFRSATVDMIQHLGQGGGLRRRAWTLDKTLGIRWPKPIPFFAPDLAMRVSWSPSYVNVSDGSARVLASANMLNFRFPIHRSEATYVGLELSLLDPLAPLSELAVRKTDKTHYDRVPNLFANVFSPRLEAVAGVPALSEHLAVAAGMSLRMAGATPDPTGTAKNNGEPSYIYSMFYNAQDADGKSLWPRFLEFGFAAKYVL